VKTAVVTYSRAEYAILYPILKAIDAHPSLDYSLIVTGMHLSDEFGHTIDVIKKDGFKIDAEVECLPEDDTGTGMAKSIGTALNKITAELERIKPDLVLVGFDLGVHLATAIAAAHMNIPVAHIHGGEVSGSIDESVRHAITKFAHVHFVATKEAKERVLKLGEEEFRVHLVGAPRLDTILNKERVSKEKIAGNFGLDLETPIILATQHPVTTEEDKAAGQMRTTLEALEELGYQTILSYPNADSGGRRMIGVVEEYSGKKFLKAKKSFDPDEYLALMSMASVMVGNSSSGLIDAPSFELPVVNIGNRQKDRLRAKNVIDVGYNKEEIKQGIEKALGEEFKKSLEGLENPYGDGTASKKIVDVLAGLKINKKLLEKRMTY